MSGECNDCGEHALECRCGEMKSEPKVMMKWISVKGRPPERHETILLGWDGEQFIPYDKVDGHCNTRWDIVPT